jgi:replicative DNA helicase
VSIQSLGDVAAAATARFSTFTSAKPDLIPTGIGALDRRIGGMTPQMTGLLVMARGVGKSSLALTAGYESAVKVGILSLEDAEDEVGLRLLSLKTGINGLDIRLKRLSPEDKRQISIAQEELSAEKGLVFAFRVGGSLRALEEGLDELGEAGCRFMWIDYAQKVRGHAEQRKDEVAATFTTVSARLASWNAAGIVLSQLTDVPETKRPRLTQVRDSKDLLNEARLGIVGWQDDADASLIHFSLDKSMVGGDGLRWAYRRDASGTLREMTEADDFAGDY